MPKLYEGNGKLRVRERGETIKIPLGKEKLIFFRGKQEIGSGEGIFRLLFHSTVPCLCSQIYEISP